MTEQLIIIRSRRTYISQRQSEPEKKYKRELNFSQNSARETQTHIEFKWIRTAAPRH